MSEEADQAFAAHIRSTEARLESSLRSGDGFFWATTPELRAKLRRGGVICRPRQGRGSIDVAKGRGLIQHWVGAVFIPGASVADVLKLIQDYDRHKISYGPTVIDSRLLERNGDDFKVRLRLKESKFRVTLVLDTEYDIRYRPLQGRDWRSTSESTRIVEIANYRRPGERAAKPSEQKGYLWRLNTYWLFRERDDGTYVECEAVSLSQNLPVGTRTLTRAIVREIAKSSLEHTLSRTRELLAARTRAPRH